MSNNLRSWAALPGAVVTIYAVALAYVRNGEVRAFPRIISVSGNNPLTPQEAFDRAVREFDADWPTAELGPRSEWRGATGQVSWLVQTTSTGASV